MQPTKRWPPSGRNAAYESSLPITGAARYRKHYRYIEKRNPRAATEVAARIRFAAERLGDLPYMGHIGRARGTFEWVVVGLPYVIVYEIDEAADEVAVIAVFHGAQDRDD